MPIAEARQTIALVGETGGGKTTVANLCRPYSPKRGTIRIDGRYISTITLSSLREHLGIVPQNLTLLNMSIVNMFDMGASKRRTTRSRRLAKQLPYMIRS